MMDQRQNAIYPTNLTDLLAVSYQQNSRILSEGKYNAESYTDTADNDRSTPVSALDDGDSSHSTFGVDLTGKATNLGAKSFTIAAILGLAGPDEDVMNLTVQERLHQNQRQLQNYLYSGQDVQRLNDGFRNMVGVPTALRQGMNFLPSN